MDTLKMHGHVDTSINVNNIVIARIKKLKIKNPKAKRI
jgi:hypothetical protein